MANRRWEREQGRKDVTDDMSEDLSEGEKGDVSGEAVALDSPKKGDVLGEAVSLDSPKKKLMRNSSNLEVWSDKHKEKKLYIVLIRYLFFPCNYKEIFRSDVTILYNFT